MVKAARADGLVGWAAHRGGRHVYGRISAFKLTAWPVPTSNCFLGRYRWWHRACRDACLRCDWCSLRPGISGDIIRVAWELIMPERSRGDRLPWCIPSAGHILEIDTERRQARGNQPADLLMSALSSLWSRAAVPGLQSTDSHYVAWRRLLRWVWLPVDRLP